MEGFTKKVTDRLERGWSIVSLAYNPDFGGEAGVLLIMQPVEKRTVTFRPSDSYDLNDVINNTVKVEYSFQAMTPTEFYTFKDAVGW